MIDLKQIEKNRKLSININKNILKVYEKIIFNNSDFFVDWIFYDKYLQKQFCNFLKEEFQTELFLLFEKNKLKGINFFDLEFILNVINGNSYNKFNTNLRIKNNDNLSILDLHYFNKNKKNIFYWILYDIKLEEYFLFVKWINVDEINNSIKKEIINERNYNNYLKNFISSTQFKYKLYNDISTIRWEKIFVFNLWKETVDFLNSFNWELIDDYFTLKDQYELLNTYNNRINNYLIVFDKVLSKNNLNNLITEKKIIEEKVNIFFKKNKKILEEKNYMKFNEKIYNSKLFKENHRLIWYYEKLLSYVLDNFNDVNKLKQIFTDIILFTNILDIIFLYELF